VCLLLEVSRIDPKADEGKCAWSYMKPFPPWNIIPSKRTDTQSISNLSYVRSHEEKIEFWAVITWESQMNSQMMTWIYDMTHAVHCWNTFLHTASRWKVLFTDEHAVYCRTHDSTHVMLWAGMTTNASPYEEMLEVCLMPQLKRQAAVHQHLPCNYLGHHIVVTLPHRTILCGALWRDKWLCTSVTRMCCTELRHRHSQPLRHKCFGACYTEHGGAFDVQWL
jgi:hypothetical protein